MGWLISPYVGNSSKQPMLTLIGEERAKPGKAYDAYKHTISGTSDGAWCLDDIAPSDTPLMGKRAGELIGRSAITRFANTLATEALGEISHDVPR
jgi:hypothetical protein